MRRLITALSLVSSPLAAQEAPSVVADIAPVRAIVAQIMEGVGSPSQIIPTNASPHSYAMRPSEGRALSDADMVVWVGPALTHWLEEPLDTLAPDSVRLTLMEVAGTHNLPMREAADLDAGHDHDADHAEHAQTDAADHEGHVHHGNIDPHGWLSPANGVLWAQAIAQQLGALDPANADAYMRNWTTLSEEVALAEQDIKAMLAPLGTPSFMLLHDGSYYFEERFGIEAQAFIVPGDGQEPGPASIKAVRDQLSRTPVTCAFVGPKGNAAMIETVTEGQNTRIAELDALGDGEAHYAALLRQYGSDMAACLSGQ